MPAAFFTKTFNTLVNQQLVKRKKTGSGLQKCIPGRFYLP